MIVMFWLCCIGKAKGQNVCLLGLSDSGKTLLYLRVRIIALNSVHKEYYVEYNNIIFSQIISESFMRTQNSIKENESKYERSDKVGRNFKFSDCCILGIIIYYYCGSRKGSLLRW